MSTPTLGYWKIRGLAANIRYQLEYCNVKYKMEEYAQGNAPDYNKDTWMNKKFNLGLDFPNIPYFIDGDLKITETKAIHEYIAEKWNPDLLGTTPEQRAKVTMVANIVFELKMKITMPCYMGSDREVIKDAVRERLPPILKFMGDNLYLAANEPTWVDFLMFEIIELISFVWPAFFDEYPDMEQYHEAMKNLPGLKQYLEGSRNMEKHRTFNNTQAKINDNKFYTLHYFNLYGRGEALRMLLSHAAIPYEDHLITFDQWPALKPTMPNGVVPCLELANGTKMGETHPILRYLAKQHGYYPEDPFLASKNEEILEEFTSIIENIPAAAFKQGAEREALYPKIFEETLPKFLKAIEPFLAQHKFCGGDKLGHADFFMGGYLYVSVATNPMIYAPERW